jgi:hypothetical protein
MVRTGATFADAAAEYLRYSGEDRVGKASTVEDYRSIIRVHRGRPVTPRTRNKVLNVLHGVFKRAQKVWALPLNPQPAGAPPIAEQRLPDP